jgi:broad specificity phosphatase PhoE
MANPSARLVLLRHGQGMLGTEDYDRLSERGQLQARHLGERIAAEVSGQWPAWSGALRRQRATLAALNAPALAVVDPCLNEYRVDRMVAHAVEQAECLGIDHPPEQALADPVAFLQLFLTWFPQVIECWQSDRLNDPCNGPWEDFCRRVTQPVPLWRAHLARGESVVVVTSAGVISTLVAELTGQDLARQRQLNVSLYNASVTELVLDPQGRWRLERENCVAHLADEDLKTLA